MTAVFTGIISEIGRVSGVIREGGGVRMTVEAPASSSELRVNDSISLNGACQTVIAKSARTFTVQAVEETLSKTTLGECDPGTQVNLELPVRLNERLGGHLVLGHVDCVGTIAGVEVKESSHLVTISFPPSFAKYVIPVGSIAVDGVSLTVASAGGNEFTVAVIPHTLSKTTLSHARKGMRVNLEFDVIGKYIERLVTSEKGASVPEPLTAEKLRAWGYNI
jgi:riboflavin synthase